MARDEFSSSDIRTLAERVTFHCSNPVCDARTTGPRAEFSKRLSTGKACHIHAASPKGPRYDPKMSREERGGIENAIWLCDVCARRIDDDHTRYPAEVLRGWKSEAENLALKQLGIPQTRPNVMEIVTQALTGHPSKFIEGALPNVALAAKNALEAQNPDLDFDVQLIDGVTTYTIRPSEGKEVPSIEFLPKSAKDAQEFLGKLGQGIPFSLGDMVKIRSPFPFLDGKYANVSFDPDNKLEAEISFSLGISGERLLIPGTCRIGCNRLSFECSIGSGIVSIRLTIDFAAPNESVEIKLDMESESLKEWDDRLLQRLPYFPKIKQLYQILRAENPCIGIIMEGHSIIDHVSDSHEVHFLGRITRAVEAINEFSSHLDLDLSFNKADFQNINIGHLECINKLWRSSKLIEISETRSEFLITVTKNKLEKGKPKKGTFLFVHPPSQISFFGVSINLPEVTAMLGGASYKVMKLGNGSAEIKIVQETGSPTIYEMKVGPTVIR